MKTRIDRFAILKSRCLGRIENLNARIKTLREKLSLLEEMEKEAAESFHPQKQNSTSCAPEHGADKP